MLSKAVPSVAVSMIPDMPLAVRKNGNVGDDTLLFVAVAALVNCTRSCDAFRLGAITAV